MAHITNLPTEILNSIHDHLTEAQKTPQQTTPQARQATSPTPQQVARQQAQARANFSRVNRLFHAVDKSNLALPKYAEVMYASTKSNIARLASDPEQDFGKALPSYLKDKAYIEVDCATISPEQAGIVESALKEMASMSKTSRNIRFSVNLDRTLIETDVTKKIDSAIPGIRAAAGRENFSIEVVFRLGGIDIQTDPDFSKWPRPDFSGNPNLASIDLFGAAASLLHAPAFAANPNLAFINLQEVASLAETPHIENE